MGETSEPELLRVYLRGGQVIEMTVTKWGLKKSALDNDLLSELSWKAQDGKRMPYIRLTAIDAVVVVPLETP